LFFAEYVQIDQSILFLDIWRLSLSSLNAP